MTSPRLVLARRHGVFGTCLALVVAISTSCVSTNPEEYSARWAPLVPSESSTCPDVEGVYADRGTGTEKAQKVMNTFSLSELLLRENVANWRSGAYLHIGQPDASSLEVRVVDDTGASTGYRLSIEEGHFDCTPEGVVRQKTTGGWGIGLMWGPLPVGGISRTESLAFRPDTGGNLVMKWSWEQSALATIPIHESTTAWVRWNAMTAERLQELAGGGDLMAAEALAQYFGDTSAIQDMRRRAKSGDEIAITALARSSFLTAQPLFHNYQNLGLAVGLLCESANYGYADARRLLGHLHSMFPWSPSRVWGAELVEAGIKGSNVIAYMWFELAGGADDRDTGIIQATLADEMTDADLRTARELAREWKPGQCPGPEMATPSG